MSENPFYKQYRPTSYNALPPVIKNLLIINGLSFLATISLKNSGIDLYQIFGLHFPIASHFRIWQPITYMFMHQGVQHIFLNMFALWMFGSALENYWGPKRFLLYYLVTGVGAAIVHYTVLYFTSLGGELSMLNAAIENPSLWFDMPQDMRDYINSYSGEVGRFPEFRQSVLALATNPGDAMAKHSLSSIIMDAREYYLNEGTTVVGASGSVFGVLLAFGMLFPNSLIYLYFFFPVKAKYFVALYGIAELVMGIRGSVNDNVAHFAHLGGMLFGIILILYWNKKLRNRFY